MSSSNIWLKESRKSMTWSKTRLGLTMVSFLRSRIGLFSRWMFEYKNLKWLWGADWKFRHEVTRVTVRHHEACKEMPNSYPSDRIFNLHRRTIMDSFSCILFRRQLHLDFNKCCFYQFYATISTFFDQEKFGTAPLLYVDVEPFGGIWRENDVKTSKMTSKSSYWRHAQE